MTTSSPRPAAAGSPPTGSRRHPLPWVAVTTLAVVLACGDAFWLVCLGGATGAIERVQHPFALWLRDTSLAVPLFAAAVAGALALARRRWGGQLRGGRAVVGAWLLVTLAGTAVGTTGVVVSAARDYALQVDQIRLMHSLHTVSGSEALGLAGHVHPATATATGQDAACPASCRHAERATLVTDLVSVRDGAVLLLGTNLLLSGWVLAARGGRLESRRSARPVLPAAHPAPPVTAS